MTAHEYNKKIDNSYFLHEQEEKKICSKNNINYWDYRGTFLILLQNYLKASNLITTVHKLDFNGENNLLKVRAILNKKNIANKEFELTIANEALEKVENKLFEWLDKTENPEFFITNTVYKYGAGIDYGGYGYIQIPFTGEQNKWILDKYKLKSPQKK